MTFFQALILGIIQGITEFLPISSSGHLVIIPFLLGWDLPNEQIFPFDVLIQIGTLIAMIVFYWKDIKQIAHSMVLGIRNRKPFEEVQARSGWLALLATIPAGILGLILKERIEKLFNRPSAVGILLIITAAILTVSEKITKKNRNITTLNISDAIVIGVFQALSIFPGISRSGSTISGGLLKNLDRKTAGQFAFLMAIPIMTAAGLLSLFDLIKTPNLFQFLPVMAVGFVTAGTVGFFTIRWLIGYISNHSLLPFAIYCLILGSGTLAITVGNPTSPDNYAVRSAKDSYNISYSSSVQWMLPIINRCSEKISDATFLVNRSNDVEFTSRDIHIYYGDLSSIPPYTYQLGNDFLVTAALQDNPINNLTFRTLQEIYQGNISTLKELAEACNECDINNRGNITKEEHLNLWIYPQGSFMNKVIRSTFHVNDLSPNLSVAPNPLLLMQTLSLDVRAVGFLPQKAISDPLKTISLMDLSSEKSIIPILASSYIEPDRVISSLIVCLQEGIVE